MYIIIRSNKTNTTEYFMLVDEATHKWISVQDSSPCPPSVETKFEERYNQNSLSSASFEDYMKIVEGTSIFDRSYNYIDIDKTKTFTSKSDLEDYIEKNKIIIEEVWWGLLD